MVSVELSMSDRFVEFGNWFFKVQNVEWETNYDLSYENSNTETINKVFIESEEKANRFVEYLGVIVNIILGLFKAKPVDNSSSNTVNQKSTIDNSNRSKRIKLFTYDKKPNSSFVINKHVRNRLLMKLNEGFYTKRKSNVYSVMLSFIKKTLNKKQSKLKNQLFSE